mgnify:CR=1 FL=1
MAEILIIPQASRVLAVDMATLEQFVYADYTDEVAEIGENVTVFPCAKGVWVWDFVHESGGSTGTGDVYFANWVPEGFLYSFSNIGNVVASPTSQPVAGRTLQDSSLVLQALYDSGEGVSTAVRLFVPTDAKQSVTYGPDQHFRTTEAVQGAGNNLSFLGARILD